MAINAKYVVINSDKTLFRVGDVVTHIGDASDRTGIYQSVDGLTQYINKRNVIAHDLVKEAKIPNMHNDDLRR